MTWVVAHRGASWELPGNTLPAFERAIEAGADFVELDLHCSRAGELVVCHDPPRDDVAYPTLADTLDLCRGRVGVMVELKSPYRYRRHDFVARALALLGPDDVVVSFEAGAIRAARELRPDLRTMQHAGLVTIRRAAGLGAWAVGLPDRRATPRALARARAAGLATGVYTVNEPARLRELAGLGVDAVFTDRPDLARELLG